MGQITRTTNPTGIRQIDKRHFVVRVGNDPAMGGRVFWVERFDHKAANLDSAIRIACIAHAGSTEEYAELGSVSAVSNQKVNISALATDKPLKFRFIFNRPNESLLIAYTDGIRALDEAGTLGSSLVDIEPTALNGIAWKLCLPEGTGAGEKPNVLVEKEIFPTAHAAIKHPWFGVLVMPEVMRQIALCIAAEPGALDNSETWIYPWGDFISSLGIEPPGSPDDDPAASDWADLVVEKFALKGVFKQSMADACADLNGEQKT